jgi:hypothetical protein
MTPIPVVLPAASEVFRLFARSLDAFACLNWSFARAAQAPTCARSALGSSIPERLATAQTSWSTSATTYHDSCAGAHHFCVSVFHTDTHRSPPLARRFGCPLELCTRVGSNEGL